MLLDSSSRIGSLDASKLVEPSLKDGHKFPWSRVGSKSWKQASMKSLSHSWVGQNKDLGSKIIEKNDEDFNLQNVLDF